MLRLSVGAERRAGENAPNQIHIKSTSNPRCGYLGGSVLFGITSLISLSRAIRSRAHSASLFSHISLASSLDKHKGNKRGCTPPPKADGWEGTSPKLQQAHPRQLSYDDSKDTAVLL